jgi:exodeoxyribonuclease VII large subunit
MKLVSVTEKFLYLQKHMLDKTDDKLRLLDPMIILKRGYTMLLRDGEIIASVNKLNKGDRVDLLFSDGKTSAEIQDIKPNENG